MIRIPVPSSDVGISSDLGCSNIFAWRSQVPHAAPPDLIGPRAHAHPIARSSVEKQRGQCYRFRVQQIPAKQPVGPQLVTAQVSRSCPLWLVPSGLLPDIQHLQLRGYAVSVTAGVSQNEIWEAVSVRGVQTVETFLFGLQNSQTSYSARCAS